MTRLRRDAEHDARREREKRDGRRATPEQIDAHGRIPWAPTMGVAYSNTAVTCSVCSRQFRALKHYPKQAMCSPFCAGYRAEEQCRALKVAPMHQGPLVRCNGCDEIVPADAPCARCETPQPAESSVRLKRIARFEIVDEEDLDLDDDDIRDRDDRAEWESTDRWSRIAASTWGAYERSARLGIVDAPPLRDGEETVVVGHRIGGTRHPFAPAGFGDSAKVRGVRVDHDEAPRDSFGVMWDETDRIEWVVDAGGER